MLKIRLSRVGKKNQPIYRVVLAEHTRPVKGKFLEILGVYDPRGKQGEPKLNSERINYWLKQGAQVSPRVAGILQQAKVVTGQEKSVQQALKKLAQKKAAKRKPRKESEKSTEAQPAKAETAKKEESKTATPSSQPEVKPAVKGDKKPDVKPAAGKPATAKKEQPVSAAKAEVKKGESAPASDATKEKKTGESKK